MHTVLESQRYTVVFGKYTFADRVVSIRTPFPLGEKTVHFQLTYVSGVTCYYSATEINER